jgi:hypothetical protein
MHRLYALDPDLLHTGRWKRVQAPAPQESQRYIVNGKEVERLGSHTCDEPLIIKGAIKPTWINPFLALGHGAIGNSSKGGVQVGFIEVSHGGISSWCGETIAQKIMPFNTKFLL